jgi:Trp operon repressor
LQQNRTSLGILSLSNRHCDIHDPSNPKSKYRADLRYKKAFDQEILALQFPVLQKSNFPTTLKYTPGYEGELRKAAYDLVHSKLLLKLHLDETPKKSLAAQVLELKQKGLKQSEIAQLLGKSRQEISRANKKLLTILPELKSDPI